jgi:SecD/SecF fusion protein
MRYKSAIIWLSTIISALCIFFLSFSWKADQLRDQANAYATSKDGTYDPAKRLHFIDSLWKQPVYLGYTFQEVTQYALHKGLDLEGGLHAVLEVSPVEILRALSGKSNDPNFEKALAQASAKLASSNKPFNELFYEEFAAVAPNQTLASVFANSVNRGKISSTSSDSQVKKVIDAEIDGAVDRVYKIIQARIDKFGVANPNIQRLPGSNRIQVELPGVDNPERARKLLSGAAKLEFIECFELNEYGVGLNALGALLDQEAKAPTVAAPAAAPAAKDTSTNSLASQLAKPATKDSGKAKADTSAGSALTKLFLPLGNGIGVYRKDTARVNALFRRADVKAFFPANLTFAWAAKGIPATNGDEILTLEALNYGCGARF